MFTKMIRTLAVALAAAGLFACSSIAIGAEESSWGRGDFSFTYSSYNANGTIAGKAGYGTQTGTDSTLMKFNTKTDQYYTVMPGVGVLLEKNVMTGSTEYTDPQGKLNTMTYTGEGFVTSYKYDSTGMLIGGDITQSYKSETSLDGKVITVTEGTTSGTCGQEDIFFGEVVFRNTQTDYKKYDYYTWTDTNGNNLTEDSELTENTGEDINSVGYSTAKQVYDRIGGRNVVTDTYSYDVSAESQEVLDYLKSNYERDGEKSFASTSSDTGDAEEDSFTLKGQIRWQETAMHTHYDYDDQGHLISAWGTGGAQGNNGDGNGYWNTWGKDADTWLNGSDDVKGILDNLDEVIEKAESGDGSFANIPEDERSELVTDLGNLKTKFQSDNYWAENIQPSCNRSGDSDAGNLGQGIFTFYTITSTGQAKERFTFQETFTSNRAGEIPNQTDPQITGSAIEDEEGNWYLRTEDAGTVSLSGDVAKANLNEGQTASVNGGWLGYSPQNAVFVVK